MKTFNTIWNMLLSTGVVGMVAGFAWGYFKPLLDNKAQHASTAQSREMFTFLEKVADMAVTSLVGKDIAGSQKFDEATRTVQQVMANQGMPITQATAETAVQSAYEKSDLTGTTSTVDPVKAAMQIAPNRSNTLLFQGREEQAKG